MPVFEQARLFVLLIYMTRPYCIQVNKKLLYRESDSLNVRKIGGEKSKETSGTALLQWGLI